MPKDAEHHEQKALIRWADLQGAPINKIYAIPNGGHRHKAVAAKLKAEGVRAGIPDLCLPVARHGYHALYIEMKAAKGTPTKSQLEKIEMLREEGNLCVICWGWNAARETIESYMNQ